MATPIVALVVAGIQITCLMRNSRGKGEWQLGRLLLGGLFW